MDVIPDFWNLYRRHYWVEAISESQGLVYTGLATVNRQKRPPRAEILHSTPFWPRGIFAPYLGRQLYLRMRKEERINVGCMYTIMTV